MATKMDKKTKAKITKETFAIWEMGFNAGYETCKEDFIIDKRIRKEPDKKEDLYEKDIYNKDIVGMLSEFKKYNPAIQYGHRGYRKACVELLKIYGSTNAIKMVQYAISIQGKPFAPSISNPSELLYKINKLERFSQNNS